MHVDMSISVLEKGSWKKVDTEARRRSVQGGVYRVHALAATGISERYKPIGRLLGTDPMGLLYIGRAGEFTGRVTELWKALMPGLLSNNHQFARSYATLSAVVKMFPVSCLRITLRFTAEPAQAEQEELFAYREVYGELPPFNSSMPAATL